MGIHLESKNKDVYMGYGSFYRLRREIAGLLSKEWQRHYEHGMDCITRFDFDVYNAKTERMYEELDKRDRRVVNFLYMSDCEGYQKRKGCKAVRRLMRKNTHKWLCDTQQFCYVVHDSFTLSDFYDMLEDGIETGKGIKWI